MRKLALLLFFTAGCTFHSTDSTEVGVLTRKIALFGKAGVQQETYPPGATYTFPAFVTDWNVYNVALQNLEMVRTVQKARRAANDDVEVIHDKKLAEQTAERMVSEGHAAQQEALRNLETAKGQVAQKIAGARGALHQVKLHADADFFASQREAEAILAEKKARAQGVEKTNKAMSGAGGRAMVKLSVAEALKGKQIIFLPSGSKAGGLQTLNLNDLLARFAYAETSSPKPVVKVQDDSK